jgi:hypothetical protein
VVLLGAVSAVAVIVASPGGEEEVVQQPASITPTPGSPTPTLGASTTPSPGGSATPLPSPDSSPDAVPADWQTYDDPVLGFSLRYPADLVFKDRTQPSPVDGLSERALEFRSSTEPPPRAFTISVSSNSKGLTSEQWLLRYAACLPGTIGQGIVAGRGATFCTSEPAEVPEAAVALEHMGKMFFITAVLPPAELEQIIASLRL